MGKGEEGKRAKQLLATMDGNSGMRGKGGVRGASSWPLPTGTSGHWHSAGLERGHKSEGGKGTHVRIREGMIVKVKAGTEPCAIDPKLVIALLCMHRLLWISSLNRKTRPVPFDPMRSHLIYVISSG